MTPPASDRLARVDALRGAAILAVVGYHMLGAAFRDRLPWAGLWADPAGAPDPRWWAFYPLTLGWVGVPLFFVLSGYVIRRSHARGGGAWPAFFARRGFRLLPAYFVALAAFAVYGGYRLAGPDVVRHALLVHNFYDMRSLFSVNPAFWSLAVEVQLYLLYPVAAAVAGRWGAGAMLAAGAAVAAAWLGWSAATADWAADPDLTVWFGPLALWPSWLLGAFLADRHAAGRRAFGRPWAVAAAGFLAVAAAAWSKPAYAVAAFSLAAVASAGLLEGYLFARRAPGAAGRTLAAVGVVSYSLYLIHQPLTRPFLDTLAAAGVGSPAGRLACGLVLFPPLAAAVALALYATAERPGMALGRRLTARRPPNQSACRCECEPSLRPDGEPVPERVLLGGK